MRLTGAESFVELNSTDFGGNVLLTYRPGTDRAALESRLAEAYPLDFPASSHVQAPGRLLNLDTMRELVVGLLTFCALLAAVALAHALVVSTRRRGHELGVLNRLGMVKRQLRSIVWITGAHSHGGRTPRRASRSGSSSDERRGERRSATSA